ncbi:MAG: DUF5667 domain-containing protein [Dehalococcoidia bacterium]
MNKEDSYDELEPALDSLRDVPPFDPSRKAAARVTFLSEARRLRQELPVSKSDAVRHKKVNTGFMLFTQGRFGMVARVLAVVLLLTGATTGVAYASDGAGPGDALYGVDTAIEQARLRLANNPSAQAELHLQFAAERIEEAAQKASRGDNENAQAALSAYGAEIASAAQLVAAARGPDSETLAGLLDAALSVHETQLGSLLATVPEQAQEAVQGAIDASRAAREHAAPQGKPEDTPQGQPEELPGGKPEELPGGKPEEVPAGPPDS